MGVKVLESFYQIREAPTQNVSGNWKLIHLSLFLLISIASFGGSFCFGRASNFFLYNCLIGSNIVFSSDYLVRPGVLPNTTRILEIDLSFTVWGRTPSCNFVHFTPLISLISAIVWGCFFLFISKGGAGYKNDIISAPWKMVYPCILYSIGMFIAFIICTLLFSKAIGDLCDAFSSQLGSSGCTHIDDYTLQFNEVIEPFYAWIKTAERFYYIGFIGWFAQLFILICRVITAVDFQVEFVTIYGMDDDTKNEVFTSSSTLDIMPGELSVIMETPPASAATSINNLLQSPLRSRHDVLPKRSSEVSPKVSTNL